MNVYEGGAVSVQPAHSTAQQPVPHDGGVERGTKLTCALNAGAKQLGAALGRLPQLAASHAHVHDRGVGIHQLALMRRERPSLANPEADGAEGDAGAWQVLRSEQRDQPSRLDAARGENLRHRTVLARVYCLDDGPIDHRAAIEGSVQRV